MYEAHYNQLQSLANELKNTAQLDSAVWIFVTTLLEGLKPDTKSRTMRVIIARLATEAGIKLDLATSDQCPQCADPFDINVLGRPKVYCSNACKQKAKRIRSKL